MRGRGKRESRTSMREGDRILINKGISKKVFIVARVDVPHSSERVFVSKSGGKYTIGLKVWKTDYAWSEKNQMWVPKHYRGVSISPGELGVVVHSDNLESRIETR